jgi:broad specificity phosphatase PhoE
MKRIIFVRHGESTQNKDYRDNKSYDKNNIKLTELGEKQAMITGKYLYKIFGKFDKVYSSPATRCIETAIKGAEVKLPLLL